MLTPRSSLANRSRHRLTPPHPPASLGKGNHSPLPAKPQLSFHQICDTRWTAPAARRGRAAHSSRAPHPRFHHRAGQKNKTARTPPTVGDKAITPCDSQGQHLRTATAERIPACAHRHPNHLHGTNRRGAPPTVQLHHTGSVRGPHSSTLPPSPPFPPTHSHAAHGRRPASHRTALPRRCPLPPPSPPLIHKPSPPRQSLPAPPTAGPPPSACERP